ncbi:MAG: phage tail assembly chaperone [Robiginitomaculum sp.]|nr:MAG: phage tail assembly chaperone [Robiginitomaculum sp.]
MLPWRQMLCASQRHFSIAPPQFWSLSVLEWRCLHHPQSGYADRSALGALMAQFPDQQEQV